MMFITHAADMYLCSFGVRFMGTPAEQVDASCVIMTLVRGAKH